MSAASDEEMISTIIQKLAAYDIRNWGPYPETGKGLRRAAVLLPLTVRSGEVFILLTKRSKNLRSHPSAVAFPGGIRDETDSSDIETALREAEEEIGLPRDHVQILGILSRGITLPNTVVYPVVGLIPNDFIPQNNPSEVEFSFFMPLRDFISKEKVAMKSVIWHGKSIISRSITYSDNEKSTPVWGFTANYCTLLAKIVFDETESIPLFSESMTAQGLDLDFKRYFNYFVSLAESKL